MSSRLEKFKARALEKPEVRAEYDKLAEEFELLDEILKARAASGLTQAQVHALRDRHSIYAVDSGRICIAALSTGNVDYVARAITEVLLTTP